MILNEFTGQDNIKLQINKSIDSGMFSHAHLIVGEDGIGKSLIAKGIAIKLIGKFQNKEYADVIEYRVSKNKQSIGIREVTDKIIEEINKKPYEGDKKVIIIYEADKMTIDAQNAFLKTVEEPPKGVYIILLCENLGSILDTIRSRCQIHKLQRLTNNEMETFLRKKYSFLTSKDLKAIIAFSEGIPGRAEKYITDEEFKEIRIKCMDILVGIKKLKTSEYLKYEDFFSKYKNRWQEVLTWILSYIRDIMVYKETGIEEILVNIDMIDSIKDVAAMFSFNKLNDIIDIVNDTKEKLNHNVNATLVFENMLIKFQEV